MIKKLLLLTSLLISGSLWASPMDTICFVDASKSRGNFNMLDMENLEKRCERNNILEVIKVNLDTRGYLIGAYCRFDRNIYESVELLSGNTLKCVLYDNKPRSRR